MARWKKEKNRSVVAVLFVFQGMPEGHVGGVAGSRDGTGLLGAGDGALGGTLAGVGAVGVAALSPVGGEVGIGGEEVLQVEKVKVGEVQKGEAGRVGEESALRAGRVDGVEIDLVARPRPGNRRLSRVDFPTPEAPANATILPAGSCSVSRRRARTTSGSSGEERKTGKPARR